jgi:hypothetical protein
MSEERKTAGGKVIPSWCCLGAGVTWRDPAKGADVRGKILSVGESVCVVEAESGAQWTVSWDKLAEEQVMQ